MPAENRDRYAHRRRTRLHPDNVLTLDLPGEVSVTVDTIAQTITVDGQAGGWTVTDQRAGQE